MKGLIKETESFIDKAENIEVIYAGLIAEAQRVQHYELSGYGTAVSFAKKLGHVDIASKLQNTLDDECNVDNVLDKLAENRLNKKAIK